MGSSYSCTNLGSDCTSFAASDIGTVVSWGDSFQVSMSSTETSDTDFWGVLYTMGQKKSCGFSLSTSRDDNGVESILFGLKDSVYNESTSLALEIKRDGHGGLRGGIRGIYSTGRPPSSTSCTRAKQNCSIETTILSYGCSQRDCLFVLEMKNKVNSDNAYMVTLAHYYLTKDVGLSVVAKIQRKKGGFCVEVEGPFKHPSTDLRKVVVQTRRTGAWNPAACSHCYGAKGSTSSSQSGVSHYDQSDETYTVGQLINHPFFSRKVREPTNPNTLYLTVNNYFKFDESVLNNGGSSRGHGTGSIVRGNFDASKRL